MGKRFAFDLAKAIPAAWALCWADNLKTRAKGGTYRPSTTFYLTASDIENQVRLFAEETAAGEAWGTRGRAWGRGYGFTVRVSGDLKRTVRDWLLNGARNGRLESHNFGRGHISGMRFRPAGEPISDAEQTTIKVKKARADKPLTKHFSKRYGHPPLCTAARRSPFARPSRAWTTTQQAEVTCPRCLNLLKAKEAA
jgi:hypothetical protein